MATVAETLDARVDELCTEHGIVRERSSCRGRAGRRGGQMVMRCPTVRGQVSGLVGLHEIGHLVGPGRSALRLEAEANAWLWALDAYDGEVTDATRRAIGRRLDSYLQWALARQHRRRPPRIPAPDHPFWRLRAWREL